MEDNLFNELTTTKAVDDAIAGLPDMPSMASVKRLLEGHREVLAKVETDNKRLLPFVKLVNATLGPLPEYQADVDWRIDPACQAVSIVTLEVDDTSGEQVEVTVSVVNGATPEAITEKRWPRMLARHVTIGAPIKVLEAGKGSKGPNTKPGARVVVVTKMLNGQTVWRKRFSTGTKAVAAEGLSEGKQSANAFLAGYRIGGIRYLVDYAEDVADADSLPLDS